MEKRIFFNWLWFSYELFTIVIIIVIFTLVFVWAYWMKTAMIQPSARIDKAAAVDFVEKDPNINIKPVDPVRVRSAGYEIPDIIDCSQYFDSRQKLACGRVVEGKVTRPEICAAWQDKDYRDWCYYFVAGLNQDADICENINCDFTKEDCLEACPPKVDAQE